MKKYIAALLCLLLAFHGFAALAEDSAYYDTAENQDGSAGSIEIEINGRATSLAFDKSEEYSIVDGGTVQASFYAYSENREQLYELFMIFPDDVQAGTTVTAASAAKINPNCAVALAITVHEQEQLFYAGLRDGKLYPSDSAYTIVFDTVTHTASEWTFTGTLTAALIDLSLEGQAPLVPFAIEKAPFSFTIPVNVNAQTEDPFSNFTTPDPYNPFDSAETPAPTRDNPVYRV